MCSDSCRVPRGGQAASPARWWTQAQSNETNDRTGGSNSLISVTAGVSAGQSKHTRTPPEAATLAQQRASGENFGPRVNAGQDKANPASWAPARNQGHEHKAVVRAARRAAPCNLLALAADAEYRDCSCRGAEREAESRSHEIFSRCQPRKLMPNPSLKRSANGMARWPSSAGPAAHFALAVQRAMPSSPA